MVAANKHALGALHSDGYRAYSNLRAIDKIKILRWFMAHAGDVPQHAANYAAFEAATDIEGKWAAIKDEGDLIVATIADFPKDESGAGLKAGQPITDEDVDKEFHALAGRPELQAKAIDPARVQRIIQFVITYLPWVLKLLGVDFPIPGTV